MPSECKCSMLQVHQPVCIFPLAKPETLWMWRIPSHHCFRSSSASYYLHHHLTISKCNPALSNSKVDPLTLANKPETRMIKRLEALKKNGPAGMCAYTCFFSFVIFAPFWSSKFELYCCLYFKLFLGSCTCKFCIFTLILLRKLVLFF